LNMLGTNATLICDICRRRPAIYRRRDSGERLCIHCLSKSLIKRLRKGISRYTRLRHGALIAVLTLKERIVESIVLAEIISIIEERHGGHVLVIVPDNTVFQAFHTTVKRRIPFMHILKSSEDTQYSNILEVINDLASLVKNLGFRIDAILTPLTLNDFFEIQLQSLFTDPSRVNEVAVLPKIMGQSIIVHPMSKILRQDIYTYALLKGILKVLSNYTGLNTCIAKDRCIASILKNISSNFSEHHPELVFKFVETLTSLIIMTGKGNRASE